jgi:hypothetical protein
MGVARIWFQDEARIGQKNKVTRRWSKRGTRPSAPHDQRTSSAYIFGAICPAEGKGAGLVLPPETVKPWRFIWRKSRLRSRPARTPSFFLIRRDGMSRRGFPSQTTSRSCCCRRNRPSSIRSRTSGNSCATIGPRTAASNPTTTSSTLLLRLE